MLADVVQCSCCRINGIWADGAACCWGMYFVIVYMYVMAYVLITAAVVNDVQGHKRPVCACSPFSIMQRCAFVAREKVLVAA
jgi:hypothetical protein